MALAPPPATDPGADMGTDTGTDTDTDDTGETDAILVTISAGADGGYVVYRGEPQDADDAGGEAGGEAPAPGGQAGQQCDSIGTTLKAALDILKEHENSAGGAGSSEDQFMGGYSGDQSATPAAGPPGRLKYPPAAVKLATVTRLRDASTLKNRAPHKFTASLATTG